MGRQLLIRRSPLSNEWYAFSAYRVRPIIDKRTGEKTGEYLQVTGKKWDVTDQIKEIILTSSSQKVTQ